MKLYEVFDQLDEGVKFTTAQIEEVKQMSNEIMLGLEYEYHVNYEIYKPYTKQSKTKDPAVSAIYDILTNNNTWHIDTDDIKTVKSELLVPPGVELVTWPLPLNRALSEMKLIFDHISDVGSTSEETGLHSNISLKHESFTKENFNPVKLVMLMDDHEILGRYPVRNFVDSMAATFTDNQGWLIVSLAEMMVSEIYSLGQAIRDVIVENIQKYNKMQGMNFRHMFDANVKEYEKRVEFRYIGGEGYENRYNEITRDIYKQCYMLLAAFDETFLEKEYLKNMVRLLDNLVKTATITVNGNKIPQQDSFLDFRKTVQHYGEGFNFRLYWKREYRVI